MFAIERMNHSWLKQRIQVVSHRNQEWACTWDSGRYHHLCPSLLISSVLLSWLLFSGPYHCWRKCTSRHLSWQLVVQLPTCHPPPSHPCRTKKTSLFAGLNFTFLGERLLFTHFESGARPDHSAVARVRQRWRQGWHSTMGPLHWWGSWQRGRTVCFAGEKSFWDGQMLQNLPLNCYNNENGTFRNVWNVLLCGKLPQMLDICYDQLYSFIKAKIYREHKEIVFMLWWWFFNTPWFNNKTLFNVESSYKD